MKIMGFGIKDYEQIVSIANRFEDRSPTYSDQGLMASPKWLRQGTRIGYTTREKTRLVGLNLKAIDRIRIKENKEKRKKGKFKLQRNYQSRMPHRSEGHQTRA